MKTVPAPHIPTPAHPLSTPRLPRIVVTEGQHPPLVADDPPECEHCGETDGHDPDCQDYEAPENDDCETEAEWLDRRLGW